MIAKATLAILLICLFASQEVFAAKAKLVSIERVKEHKQVAPKPKIELCEFCVSFMDQAIGQLLNIIANVGVVGGCAGLCSYLPNSILSAGCNMLCDVVGIEEFVKLVDDADPDPIWICEELSLCTINDNAKANMTQLTVSPKNGQQGDTFNVFITLQVTNAIGTGEIAFEVNPPQGDPFGDGGLILDLAPGLYRFQFQFAAEPSQDQPFVAGGYQVIAAACEGSCGSTHSHSFVLAEKESGFQISQ